MLRFGTVTDRQPSTGRVRVSFLEDDLVTQWIPVLSSAVNGNKFYAMPDIGDQVAVAMQDADIGVVLGSFYSSDQPIPEAAGGDVTMVQFTGDVSVKYDRQTKELTVRGVSKVFISATEVEITASGGVNINGDLKVSGDMAADGEVTAKSGLTSVSLSTHTHLSASPGTPTSPPTAGT